MTWDGVLYALLGAGTLFLVLQCIKQVQRDELERRKWRQAMRELDAYQMDGTHGFYMGPSKRYEHPDSSEQRID